MFAHPVFSNSNEANGARVHGPNHPAPVPALGTSTRGDDYATPKEDEEYTGPWITDPHGDDEANGSCGRAILKEYRRTIGTHWREEFTNFNQKTLAVSFFIFFAAVAPAITFGSVYAKSTSNYIGAVEMLTATAWCGVFYAIFGGQPMVRSFLSNKFLLSSFKHPPN